MRYFGPWIALTLAFFFVGQAHAQVSDRPIPLASAVSVRGSLNPSGAPAAASRCYAIDTLPGSEWRIVLQTGAANGNLVVARGSLCGASRLMFTSSGSAGSAQLEFTAAGGRYLIYANSPSDQPGEFTLSASTPLAPATEALTSPPLASSAPPIAAAATLADASTDPRLIIMNRQVADHAARLAAQRAEQARIAQEQARAAQAAQEARWRAQEAERRESEERAQGFLTFVTGVVGVLETINNPPPDPFAETSAQFEAQIQQIVAANTPPPPPPPPPPSVGRPSGGEGGDSAADAAEEARRANERRVLAEAEQRRLAAQQAQETARRAAAERARLAELERTRPIEMLEAVVLCEAPPTGSRAWGCRGPLQYMPAVLDTPQADVPLSQACGSNSVRSLGLVGGYRAFGCGFGINPGPYGAFEDIPARYGMSFIPGRMRFHCSREVDTCRNQ